MSTKLSKAAKNFLSARPAVLLARVSTEQQLKMSLGVQIDRGEAWAKSQGYPVIAKLTDVRSGRRADREGLQEAVALACQHKAVLITYDSTRLFRNARHMLNTFNTLEEAGAAFATVTEPLMDTRTNTSFARFVRTLMGAIGQLYAEQTGEKIAESNRATVRRLGHRTNGRQPPGWKLKKIIKNGHAYYRRRRELHEEWIIAMALYAAMLCDGPTKQWSKAAKLLNEWEVPTISGYRVYRDGHGDRPKWNHDTVFKLWKRFKVTRYVPAAKGGLKERRGERGPYKKREAVA